MKIINNILITAVVTAGFFSCDPEEDRVTPGKPLSPSEVKYAVTQDASYANRVFLENQTQGAIAHWDFGLGTSTRDRDTVIFPFAGDYAIKFTAYGRAGAVEQSTSVTIPENDPNYFADPGWSLLTNGVDGKSWKLVRVTLGPAKDYKTIWTDVGWWGADTYNWDDRLHFDLNGDYNYTRFHDGEAIESSFYFNPNEVLTGTVIPDPGQSITILGENQMAIKDGSNEMSELNKTRYRIYKLSTDTLIVGQGSYYTASRNTPNENWGFFHWYVWDH